MKNGSQFFKKKAYIFGSLAVVFVGAFLALTHSENKPIEFDIHIVVLTKNQEAQAFATLAQLYREVDVLNQNFVTEKREPIVRFRFKSAAFYEDIKSSPCQFIKYGDQSERFPHDQGIDDFNACNDPQVKDPHAINFYIFNSTWDDNVQWKTSYTGFNWFHPFVLQNWHRLKDRYKASEEHEMGHVFGLLHSLSCGADDKTHTDFMASSDMDFCHGTGGDRTLGLGPFQTSIVKRTALILARKLAE